MTTRQRVLPPGWYPGTKDETIRSIKRFLSQLEGGGEESERYSAPAGVAPHAGWEFSGKTALEVILNLDRRAETVVVVGGHLSSSGGVLAAHEDAYETPLGDVSADRELLEELETQIHIAPDRAPDNTVEIQLPLVKYVFPDAAGLYLRVSPSSDAIRLGEAIENAAAARGKKTVVLGSTDLTHYGSNYGFTPQGSGEAAVRWVKEVNDREFITALLEMDGEKALAHARSRHSACSAGAAVAALAYARSRGAEGGELLDYLTSYDIFPNESFVGYAGIVFPID